MIDINDCAGCRNDFYNEGNNALGVKRCWSAERSTMSEYLFIHINQEPPYEKRKAKLMPDCYRRPQFVKVKPEALDREGYWKS